MPISGARAVIPAAGVIECDVPDVTFVYPICRKRVVGLDLIYLP